MIVVFADDIRMESMMTNTYTREKGLLRLIAFLCLTIFLGGCKGQEENTQRAEQTFEEFTEEIFEEFVTTDTISLHFSLAHPENYDVSLEEVTFGEIALEYAEEDWEIYEQWEQRLTSYSKEDLTREQQITYDVFQAYLDSCMSSKDLFYYYEPFIPGTGVHANLPYLMAEYTFYNKQDIEDYLELFSLMDGYYQKLVEWETYRVKEGLFMSDSLLEQVIEECDTYIFTEEIDETNFIYETFLARIDQVEGLTEEEKADYKNRQKTALKNDFSDAYRNLKTKLEDFYGSGINELGLSHLPKGKEYYEYMVEDSIGMTYKSIDILFKAIRQNLSKNFEDMYYLLSQSEDLYMSWESGEFDSREPKEMLTELQREIEEDFPALPEHSYRVNHVASSMEEFMNPAFYLMPPIDRYEENVIYINNGATEGTNLYPILAHEGYPGHLYQNVYFLSQNNCNLRHAFSFPGYSEGWATYVQMYVRDWDNAISNDLARLTYLEELLNLGISAYLDIGINYYGWNQKETTKNTQDLLGELDEEAVNDMFEILVSNPGVYLDYYVGYLEIIKLKNEAKDKLGEEYSDLEFHQFLLDFGPAPFSVIKPYFEEWVN